MLPILKRSSMRIRLPGKVVINFAMNCEPNGTNLESSPELKEFQLMIHQLSHYDSHGLVSFQPPMLDQWLDSSRTEQRQRMLVVWEIV